MCEFGGVAAGKTEMNARNLIGASGRSSNLKSRTFSTKRLFNEAPPISMPNLGSKKTRKLPTSVRVDMMILHGFLGGTASMPVILVFLHGIAFVQGTRKYFSISIRKNVYETVTSLPYIVILF